MGDAHLGREPQHARRRKRQACEVVVDVELEDRQEAAAEDVGVEREGRRVAAEKLRADRPGAVAEGGPHTLGPNPEQGVGRGGEVVESVHDVGPVRDPQAVVLRPYPEAGVVVGRVDAVGAEHPADRARPPKKARRADQVAVGADPPAGGRHRHGGFQHRAGEDVAGGGREAEGARAQELRPIVVVGPAAEGWMDAHAAAGLVHDLEPEDEMRHVL